MFLFKAHHLSESNMSCLKLSLSSLVIPFYGSCGLIKSFFFKCKIAAFWQVMHNLPESSYFALKKEPILIPLQWISRSKNLNGSNFLIICLLKICVNGNNLLILQPFLASRVGKRSPQPSYS